MQLLRPSPEMVPFVVRAMKTIAVSAGTVHPGARALIEAAQDFLAGKRLEWETLEPITPAELAAHVTDPAARAQIVHGMVTVSLVDEVPPRAQTETIRAFANALGVKDGMLETVDKLVAGHMNQFRFCFLRRAHLKNFVASQIADAGLIGTARAIATSMGLTEDKKLAARYAALGDLPAGSLGRELHRYYLRNAFPWPGQKLAAPEAIVSHDVTHILSGYDTDPIGETLIAAFTAGYQKDPGLFFTPLIGLVMFSTGVHVIPNPNVPTLQIDAFSKPEVAKRWFRAIERGSVVNTDLTKRFDLWSVAQEPVEALRERWNIEGE